MSAGSDPWIASSSSALSATVLASAPNTLNPSQPSPNGWVDTRPRLGFIPTSPQHAAGIRIDPPPSDPVAHGTMPAATAAAEPPEEPPGVRVGSHGLRVMPLAALAVHGKIISSGTFVIPIGIAPAARSRRTTSPSAATGGRNDRDPRVTDWPATGMSSLIAIGTPASGPSGVDIASAAASASSASVTRNAFSLPSIASIRRRHSSTSSRGVSSRRRTIPASAPGPANASSASAVAVMPEARLPTRGSRRDTDR